MLLRYGTRIRAARTVDQITLAAMSCRRAVRVSRTASSQVCAWKCPFRLQYRPNYSTLNATTVFLKKVGT